MVTAGCTDRVLVGRHVFVPELALGDVAGTELPALGGLVETRQQALALLLKRDVQEEFEDDRSAARKMALESADALEAMLPD